MHVYCDNRTAISIAHNPILYNRKKHVEVDKHFTQEKIAWQVDNGLYQLSWSVGLYQLAGSVGLFFNFCFIVLATIRMSLLW